MIYRNVEITYYNEHYLKLFHANGVEKFAGSLYTNGEKYISIPPAWAGREIEYGKFIVDRTYEWAEYHKKFEARHMSYSKDETVYESHGLNNKIS